jgi:two-component system, NtrC family, sensor kinase
MRGLPRESEALGPEAPSREWVPKAVLDAYAEAARMGLLAVRREGALLSHSREFARLCHTAPPFGDDGTLGELITWLNQRPDEAPRFIARVLSGAEARGEGEVQLSDGRTLAWRKVQIAGGGGDVWAFADVSEMRQMAAALVDAANWLRMLEAHTDGVLLELDADARIVGLWGHGEAFFDESDFALQGKTLIDAVPGSEGVELDARVRRVLGMGGREEYEYSVDIRGTTRVLMAHAIPMPAEEDAARRVTVLLQDVTERARLQGQILQAERVASVGLLAAGVAHEINNPLAYVLLNLERIRSRISALNERQGGNADLLAAIEMSIEGASRVQAIVRDLNHFSRSDQNQRLPIDARRSLDFAIAMAEPEIGRHITLTRDFRPLPLVSASETRLCQVFLNLIINAAHALTEMAPAPGEIVVCTRTAANGEAVIEVRDTGPGISPAALRHIFEPFYTTKTESQGMGLGLAICHTVVNALGGRIEVESGEGRGSTFRVLLPPAFDPRGLP